MMNSQIIEPEDRSPAELFALLQLQQDGEGYAQTLALLEEEAFKPGNLKAFLRVLAEQPPAIRAHFYREICLKRRNSTGAMRSLEKHLSGALIGIERRPGHPWPPSPSRRLCLPCSASSR